MKKTVCILKKILCFILSAAIILSFSSIFSACADNNIYDGELLRLHIRANSDSACDQAVKLSVRDEVNAYISDNIDKTTFEDAYNEIARNLSRIEETAVAALERNGYFYGAKARLCNEYFPTRKYKDVTVPEGYYDALVIELGEGKGANWWCVVYPPLCYGEEFEYKSFFADLFGGKFW